jgi:hypothetical protein
MHKYFQKFMKREQPWDFDKMIHWNWFMEDEYFGDHHYDNSKIIMDYNLL